jgi:hypothetical protein
MGSNASMAPNTLQNATPSPRRQRANTYTQLGGIVWTGKQDALAAFGGSDVAGGDLLISAALRTRAISRPHFVRL